MKKIFNFTACAALMIAIAMLGACDDSNKKLDKDGWDKAFTATLEAENFTARETMTMSGEDFSLIVDAKADYKNGKIWTKYSQSEDAESDEGESYWVKDKDGLTVYNKEKGGEWTANTESGNLNETFESWDFFGDGIKENLLHVKKYYDKAEFDKGVYTIAIPKDGEMPAMTAKAVISKGYIKTVELSAEGATLKFEFSDFGKTKMPSVPTVSGSEK